MATKDLETFLRQIQSGAGRGVDIEGTKTLWLGFIEKLYTRISEWLEPLRQKGLVALSRSVTTIREESLGIYDAPVLQIEAGGKKIFIEPIARVVFGGSGRIDMGHGPLSRVLIREPNDNDTWIISARDPKGAGRELTEETFTEALQSLLS